eukprot:5206404-Pleurochrysis_carterae.AAC.2
MAGLGGPGPDVLEPGGAEGRGGGGRWPPAAATGGRLRRPQPREAPTPLPMTRAARAARAKTCPGWASRAACGGVRGVYLTCVIGSQDRRS